MFRQQNSFQEWILSFLNTKTGSDIFTFFSVSPYLPIIWQIFTELNFLKIKTILRTNRKKKEGWLLVIFALKTPVSSIRAAAAAASCTPRGDDAENAWPRGTFHSPHTVSQVNYPENWHNLCLKAPLLLVLYPLTFFPSSYQAYILNFNFEIGAVKHLVFNTG